MKILYTTQRTTAMSKDIGLGPSRPGVAWFEMVLHDGPADDKTWEGGGKTVAYWRENFARLINPYPWRIEASGMQGVPAAVIPDEVVQGLHDDDRISFVWTFVVEDIAARTEQDGQ